MEFKFHAEHELSKSPEYSSVLHELRSDSGEQMLTIHMDVNQSSFAPSVLKRMKAEFTSLRQCTEAPLFAFENMPDDDKWKRYVSHIGFEYLCRVQCTDGLSRRCFVSKKKNNEHFIDGENVSD